MPKMEALVPMRHINVEQGETFNATERQAKILVVLGKAKVVPLIAKATKAVRQPRQPRAPRATASEKPRRAYRRRDMQAEG